MGARAGRMSSGPQGLADVLFDGGQGSDTALLLESAVRCAGRRPVDLWDDPHGFAVRARAECVGEGLDEACEVVERHGPAAGVRAALGWDLFAHAVVAISRAAGASVWKRRVYGRHGSRLTSLPSRLGGFGRAVHESGTHFSPSGRTANAARARVPALIAVGPEVIPRLRTVA
jgi:hypothetical protein